MKDKDMNTTIPPEAATAVRVLVVDDDEALRDRLVAQLETAGMNVVGAVATVAEAMHALHGTVTLALVDMALPDGSGLDIIRAARVLGVPSLVLSVHGDDASIFGALRAGASGYCMKTDGHAHVADAIAVILAGGAAIAPGIARRLLDHFRFAQPEAAPVVGGQSVIGEGGVDCLALTSRERELMDLFAAGCTYAEVARIAGISINTVRHHVRRLYEKLHVSSKAEAVAAFLRAP